MKITIDDRVLFETKTIEGKSNEELQTDIDSKIYSVLEQMTEELGSFAKAIREARKDTGLNCKNSEELDLDTDLQFVCNCICGDYTGIIVKDQGSDIVRFRMYDNNGAYFIRVGNLFLNSEFKLVKDYKPDYNDFIQKVQFYRQFKEHIFKMITEIVSDVYRRKQEQDNAENKRLSDVLNALNAL